jgi:anti-anti-sigma factor
MDLEWLADIPPEDPPSLRVERECFDGERARLVVCGEIDAISAVRLQKAVVDLLRHHRPRFIEIDIRDVTFLDAGATKALVLCQADARQVDGQIRLTHPQPAVYRVLQLTGLLEHFGVTKPQSSNGATVTNPALISSVSPAPPDRFTNAAPA